MASNAVGTITPCKEIVEIAHEAGALAWVDAVHYAPHGDIEIAELGCDVLLCSPYKFYGPHLGLAWVRRELSRELAALQGPARRASAPGQRHETGTLPHELLCGFVACVEYLHGVGWKFITEHERKLGPAVPRRAPRRLEAARAADDGGPRLDVLRLAARRDAGRGRARGLGAAGFAVWDGNYYAVEVFKHLGLDRGRDPDRHRPHEHGGRGRPAARGAAPALAAVADKDYSGTPLGKKLGAKPGAEVLVFFTTRRSELDARLPALKATLAPADGLWIAWPKKASKLETDLDFDAVQSAGLAAGLVDNKSCSIDADWQALRFVYRLADR